MVCTNEDTFCDRTKIIPLGMECMQIEVECRVLGVGDGAYGVQAWSVGYECRYGG